MKRKRHQMSETSTPLGQQDINKSIEQDFEKNRVYWLDKFNCHLEKPLKRANRAPKFQRHMARHYYTKIVVSQIRIQNFKREIRETLIQQNKGENLELLAEASLIDLRIVTQLQGTNFKHFEHVLEFLKILGILEILHSFWAEKVVCLMLRF